jgi:hypothetical protein
VRLSRTVVVLALLAAVQIAAGSLPDAALTGLRSTPGAAHETAAGTMSAPAPGTLGATWHAQAQAAPTHIAGSAWNLDGMHAWFASTPIPSPGPSPLRRVPSAATPGLPHGPPHLLHDSLRI